ncbi:hypothetical protein [Seonamhaeicola algicola]|uniref:hypothetical protein n=1 Tax=Seonamhaeicola algicola TaxID=1719036 RepID=UPI00164C55FF|nr:hypothetical protein [Seonamhaeicola algicola]
MKKIIIAIALLFTTSIVLNSCREQKSTEDKIEEGVEEVKDGVEDAVDEVEDEL